MSREVMAEAVARMDPVQLKVLRVVAMTERRLRTHYQQATLPNGELDPNRPPFLMAQQWALDAVGDD